MGGSPSLHVHCTLPLRWQLGSFLTNIRPKCTKIGVGGWYEPTHLTSCETIRTFVTTYYAAASNVTEKSLIRFVIPFISDFHDNLVLRLSTLQNHGVKMNRFVNLRANRGVHTHAGKFRFCLEKG